MSREHTLSAKEKWALDAQLGELLRGMERTQETSRHGFQQRLEALMAHYELSRDDVLGIVKWIECH
ncbi:hypothetical protein [Larsenimonas salina]|uniref:hypothetical protein n=1 Tax=Larsenimonas salina TaxID=1295565 RepID=UPI0020732902|nr:hypothetical protein [Larsenimonas salina]MCM5703067.1 hypothetical protein [Larsenimonas salina]